MQCDEKSWDHTWSFIQPVCQKISQEILAFCGFSNTLNAQKKTSAPNVTSHEEPTQMCFTVEVILCGEKKIQAYNKIYRHKDKATNVLSFPQFNDLHALRGHPCSSLLGSIVMSYATLAHEAHMQGKTFYAHSIHLYCHGFLHLLGYDHCSARQAYEMESLEIAFLKQHNIMNPYECLL